MRLLCHDQSAKFYIYTYCKKQGEQAGKLQGYGARSIQAMNDVWARLRAILIEAGELIPEASAIEILKSYRDQIVEIRRVIQIIQATKAEKIRELRWLMEDMLAGEEAGINVMITRWSETFNALVEMLFKTEDPEGRIQLLDEMVNVGKEANQAIAEEIKKLEGQLIDISKNISVALADIDTMIAGFRKMGVGGMLTPAEDVATLRQQLEERVAAFGALPEGEKEINRQIILDMMKQYIASVGGDISQFAGGQIQEIQSVQEAIRSLEEQYISLVTESRGFETIDAEKTRLEIESLYEQLGKIQASFSEDFRKQLKDAQGNTDILKTFLESIGADLDDQTDIYQKLSNMVNSTIGTTSQEMTKILIESKKRYEEMLALSEKLSEEETRTNKTIGNLLAMELSKEQSFIANLEGTTKAVAQSTVDWLLKIRENLIGVQVKIDAAKIDIGNRIDFLKGVNQAIVDKLSNIETSYLSSYNLLVKQQLDKVTYMTDTQIPELLSKTENVSIAVWEALMGVGGVRDAIVIDLINAVNKTSGRERYAGMIQVAQEEGRFIQAFGGSPEQVVESLYRNILGRGVDPAGWGWTKFLQEQGLDALIWMIAGSAEGLKRRKELFGFQKGGITTGVRPVPALLSETPGLREAVIPLTPESVRMLGSELGIGGRNRGSSITINVEVRNEMLDASSADKVDWDTLVRRKIFPSFRDVLVGTGEQLGYRLEVF